MKKKIGSPQILRCSFCGRGQDEVTKLISGPSVYICNECIKLCKDILDDEISEFALLASDRTVADPLRDALVAELGDGFEVRTWGELQPLLVYMIEMFESMGWIIYAVVPACSQPVGLQRSAISALSARTGQTVPPASLARLPCAEPRTPRCR